MSNKSQKLHLGYRASSVSGELLSLCQEDRRRHLYVIGQTGSGKTTFLKHCILQDIHMGAGIALIDPHGDLAEDIVNSLPRSRVRDVIFFNPLDREFPLGFNPLAPVPDNLRAVVVSNIVASLRSIWRSSWGPRMEHVLANTLAALTTDSYGAELWQTTDIVTPQPPMAHAPYPQ
jgi:DNA helicase HerA-like ATPase